MEKHACPSHPDDKRGTVDFELLTHPTHAAIVLINRGLVNPPVPESTAVPDPD